MMRRLLCVLAAVTAVLLVAGCSRAVEGTAVKAGAGDRGRSSEQQYPNLLRECDQLDEKTLTEAIGANEGDIMSTFVGAVCRWQSITKRGNLVDITRFWFEEGSLDNEISVTEQLGYAIENRAISGIRSIVVRPNDPNGSCGVVSDAQGVVGWWVNPQSPGEDACEPAVKLMELTLQTTS
ncbi:DUF3558 domain-containing protein [Mycobacterium sp. MYCO198283]|uniref:DUF3558 domain-containing protein n=1 Tax=Mycobacterium sp. MYCO198283 TaxID=2883505 RepID=UPI001E394A20|nr:DUF3558 domain-containing protein [Mycobacterium sp. MYCO198283]MCG5430728.1 DUF3558 domain-containing protein [Mycobacterium sp. MYCO198283]